ncbi:hypothetical protein AJ78_05299 [Emergomyces pasteurianus Ep9510]|uniref:Gamma interferon inducible lysosomal thiol reductase n=1 Tax=Emergomyces pasteurianus Ep9510 TaxID=1447872 RepID=A0A1J9PE87_9EURO|nr:hypothetical protein AJ78_05299 [Emergomyces pasteurianus Ep9510]
MEKHQAGDFAQPRPCVHRDRKLLRLFRRSFILICLCLITYALIHKSHFPHGYIDDSVKRGTVDSASPLRGNNDNDDAQVLVDNSHLVPLEAHIMSKCPDAQYCLEELIVPAMVQVHDKVDFRLSFIGSVSNSSSDVSCMHGPDECVGDMLILCAANLPFPPGAKTQSTMPTIRSLGFANCLLASYEKIPERALVEDCALEHGIDFHALNACASRQVDEDDIKRAGVDDPNKLSGLALLRMDFKRNAALGITKSCTVRINEKLWCIRDNQEWKDCHPGGGETTTLVDEINRLYKSAR